MVIHTVFVKSGELSQTEAGVLSVMAQLFNPSNRRAKRFTENDTEWALCLDKYLLSFGMWKRTIVYEAIAKLRKLDLIDTMTKEYSQYNPTVKGRWVSVNFGKCQEMIDRAAERLTKQKSAQKNRGCQIGKGSGKRTGDVSPENGRGGRSGKRTPNKNPTEEEPYTTYRGSPPPDSKEKVKDSNVPPGRNKGDTLGLAPEDPATMPLKETPEYALAQKFYDFLRARKLLHPKSSKKEFCTWFRKLLHSDFGSEVKEILRQYCEYFGRPGMPEAFSAKSFYEKYIKIKSALLRVKKEDGDVDKEETELKVKDPFAPRYLGKVEGIEVWAYPDEEECDALERLTPQLEAAKKKRIRAEREKKRKHGGKCR